MKYSLLSVGEVAQNLASRHKKLRLSKKWKRTTLAERSGVSLASLIRFEQTSQVSLENLLKLFSALGRLDEIEKLLLPPVAKSIADLENLESKSINRGSI